jgi:hypothetical protein
MLTPGRQYKTVVFTHDPDSDSLYYSWEILREGTDFPYGGQREKKPPAVPGLIVDSTIQKICFKAPEERGPYRLFVYIYDRNNHYATANIPFFAGKIPGE